MHLVKTLIPFIAGGVIAGTGLSQELPKAQVEPLLKIENYAGERIYLPNLWKFQEGHIDQVTLNKYQQMEQKAANTANSQYTGMARGPARGSFVLRIESDRDYDLGGLIPAISASSQIKILNSRGEKVLYQHPEYNKPLTKKTRLQESYSIFEMPIASGTNFIILNYSFMPFVRNGIDFVNAGFVQYFAIDNMRVLKNKVMIELNTLRIPLGIFLCLSVYSLLIYFSRNRKDSISFYLFILNFASFLKELGSQLILPEFFGNNGFTQLFSANVFFMAFTASWAMLKIFYLQMPSKILKFFLSLSLFNIFYTAVTTFGPQLLSFYPMDTSLVYVANFINLVSVILFFTPYSLYKGIRSKRRELVYFSVGVFIFVTCMMTDYANVIYSMHWPWVAMWGGTIFSLILAKNNSQMFADTYSRSERLNEELSIKNAEVENLNKNLELKVEERTAEIQSLLNHIPQGVLSLGEEGLIEPNFSAQLPQILGTKNIAKKSFRDLILEHSDLTVDERDQAWQTILACVGDSYFNFDSNEDKLPLQLRYKNQKEPVDLKLTWNIEIDKNDSIKHILVTLLDVTQEIKAKKALDVKNQEFELIKQLVEAGPKKAAQFFNSCKILLEENERLISVGDFSDESLKILFVNVHTFKGAARTLQFRNLSDILHQVENRYAQIMKREIKSDKDLLAADIAKARELFNQYQAVNIEVLGRSEDFSKITIDRDFLEKNFKLFQYLEHNDELPDDIREIIHNNSDELVNLIFMSLPTVLEEVLENSKKIAKDLQKEVPVIHLDSPDVMISHKQDQLIRNCAVHLLRNSLDHGIESTEERLKQGKEPEGNIYVKVTEENDEIKISTWDDGRGLAIGKLRQMGLEAGLIDENASPHEIANLIFNQGLSTAKKVSQISGRGVGMDAVRSFLEAESSHIEIELHSPTNSTGDFYSFQFHMRIPSLQSVQKAAGIA